MKRFKSRRQAQRLLSIEGHFANLFQAPANISTSQCRHLYKAALATWSDLTVNAA